MPISESVVYFFPLGDCPWGVVDQPRDGRGHSKAFLTWCQFYELIQSTKFHVYSDLTSGG